MHNSLHIAAIHVASEINMVAKGRVASLVLRGERLAWTDDSDAELAAYAPADIPTLARSHDLCVSGAVGRAYFYLTNRSSVMCMLRKNL